MTAWQQYLHGLYKEDICVSDYISINMFVFRLYYYVIKGSAVPWTKYASGHKSFEVKKAGSKLLL